MGDSGFIYVLFNPSMPGMAKVGKTNRDPQDRVSELSGASGVPTPFVLVYKEFFDNCSVAEKLIHSLLEDRGHRVSSAREFFSAPLDEIIKIVQQVRANSAPGSNYTDSSDVVGNAYAYDVFEEAKKHYYGSEGYLEDEREAINLFRKAISLGDINSYLYLGRIYRDEEKIEQALDFFKEGSKRGNNFCTAELGKTFIDRHYGCVHIENGEKSWDKYFGTITMECISTDDIRFFNDYIELARTGSIPLRHIDILSFNKDRLIRHVKSNQAYHERTKGRFWECHLERLAENMNYIMRNLVEPEETQYKDYLGRFSGEVLSIAPLEGDSTCIVVEVHRGVLRTNQTAKLVSGTVSRPIRVRLIRIDGTKDACKVGDVAALMVDDYEPKISLTRRGTFVTSNS